MTLKRKRRKRREIMSGCMIKLWRKSKEIGYMKGERGGGGGDEGGEGGDMVEGLLGNCGVC